jgi:hypothetical protein
MYLLVGFLKNPKNIFSQYKFWEKVLNVNILLEKSIILRPVNIVQNVERFGTLRCCLTIISISLRVHKQMSDWLLPEAESALLYIYHYKYINK